MLQESDTEGSIPECDLAKLVSLFIQFEGASDPLATKCREAESEFNCLIETIYNERIKDRFQSLSLYLFRGHTRNYCRRRAISEGKSFPCISN